MIKDNDINTRLFKRDSKGGKVYYIQITYYNEEGKRCQKQMSTGLLVREKGSKKEAERMLNEFADKYRKAFSITSLEWYFSDWIVHWYEVRLKSYVGKPKQKHGITQQTYESYRYQIQHIADYFNKKDHHLKLDELKSRDLDDYYEYEMEENGISANSVRKYHSNINQALNYACYEGILSTNVAAFVEVPRKETYRGKAYTESQVRELIQKIEGHPLEVPVKLVLLLGLRRGEVAGLQWEQISFEDKTLTVDRTAKYINHKMVVTHETKNQASNATMILTDSMVAFLKKVKKDQLEQQMRHKGKYNPDGYVCVDKNGDPLGLHYITSEFKKFLADNNLEEIRFHDLRHTCISMLINSGMDMKHVQTYARHSCLSTTADIYGHVSDEGKRQMADALSDKLQGII